MPTPAAVQALHILRDPGQFQWYIIPLLMIVIYAYCVEVEKRNWSVFFAGLAFWGMDWFNEIWNGLVFHFTNYAPVWGAPGKTAFLILIGLNIEITFMFALAGLAMTKILPADKNMRIGGLPSRLVMAVTGSILCVIIEMILNAAGVLTWDYSWWSIRSPWLVFLIGYLPFFLVSYWVHDMETVKRKVIAVSSILGFDICCLIVFGGILGWL
ncbi:MAG: hypothetical protein ACM3NT_10800 [Methylocystaceae bacterium]